MKAWCSRKKSICGVALQIRHCGPLGSHSSVCARLASGTLYEIIKAGWLQQKIACFSLNSNPILGGGIGGYLASPEKLLKNFNHIKNFYGKTV